MNAHPHLVNRRWPAIALSAVSMVLTSISAHAVELTDLPGVTASAGSCYLGCGHPHYDASNVLDGDYGATGNTGLNSWNSGFWGGWVQVDLASVYVLDRIELYGANGYYDPFTLSVSTNGVSWSTVASGGYHLEPRLSQTGYQGVQYGAVYDVADHTLASGYQARYVRYSVNSGTPHWGYVFEMDVQGHVAAVPEPETYALMLGGLALVGWQTQRRQRGLRA